MQANRRWDRGAAPCTAARTARADHFKSPCPFSTAAMVGSTNGTARRVHRFKNCPCPMDPFRRASSREPMLLRPDNAPLEPDCHLADW